MGQTDRCNQFLANGALLPFFSVSQEPPSRGKVSLILQVTFILLLELLVAGALPQIGKDLGELANDNVICGQCGLGLKTQRSKVIPLSRNLSIYSFIHLTN